jgi:hypothetical protein
MTGPPLGHLHCGDTSLKACLAFFFSGACWRSECFGILFSDRCESSHPEKGLRIPRRCAQCRWKKSAFDFPPSDARRVPKVDYKLAVGARSSAMSPCDSGRPNRTQPRPHRTNQIDGGSFGTLNSDESCWSFVETLTVRIKKNADNEMNLSARFCIFLPYNPTTGGRLTVIFSGPDRAGAAALPSRLA